MRHEFAVRFEPASGSKFVQADAYVRSLAGVLEGLASLRATLAPRLAEKHGGAVSQVRAALTFCIGPTEKSGLVVPLVPGVVRAGPPELADLIAQAFWKETAAELSNVRKRRASRLSATAADAFARASLVAKEGRATVSLMSRSQGAIWRSTVNITRLETALRDHARTQRSGHRAATALTGEIVSLIYDPPGFTLATSNGLRSVRMSSALRDAARENWGREVVVMTDAILDADGNVGDIEALTLRAAATAKDAAKHFDETFGILRGAWDDTALDEYLGVSRQTSRIRTGKTLPWARKSLKCRPEVHS